MMSRLILNTSLLLSLSLLYEFNQRYWGARVWPARICAGLLFGGICILGMSYPAEIAPGILLDARTLVLSMASLFGGPLVAGVAGSVAASYRLWLGGEGALVGAAMVGVSVLFGLIYHHRVAKGLARITARNLLAFGLLVQLASVALLPLLVSHYVDHVFFSLALSHLLVLAPATVLLGLLLRNLEQHRHQNDALVRSEALQAAITHASPDVMLVVDEMGTYLDIISPNEGLLYAPPREIIGKRFTDVLPAADAKKFLDFIRLTIDSGVPQVIEYPMSTLDGTHVFEGRAHKISIQVNGQRAAVFVARDISERKQIEERLRVSEQRHRLLAENARDVIWTIAPDFRITYVSPAVEKVRGLTPQEAMTQTLDQIHPPSSQAVSMAYFTKVLADVEAGRPPENFHGELEYIRKDGSTYWSEAFVYPVLDDDGKLLEIVGLSRDIDERKRFENELRQAHDATQAANRALELANDELKRLATTDALTGAGNRRHFQQVVEIEMAQARRHLIPLSLILFDVDHFKRINDNHGHQVGDQVLVSLVSLAQSRLRVGDLLARWGGEEFVILLPYASLTDAERLAERMRALFEQHTIAVAGRVTASFGVAQLSLGEVQDEWLKRADSALYEAKTAGRNRVRAG